jgi:hypothetical protein
MADKPEDLTPPTEPKTSVPIRLEQAIGPQIPITEWSKLSGDQFFSLASRIIELSGELEKKRLDQEQQRINHDDAVKARNLMAGILIVIVGIGAAVYLAINNQVSVALSITGPLATLVAVVIGRRFFS